MILVLSERREPSLSARSSRREAAAWGLARRSRVGRPVLASPDEYCRRFLLGSGLWPRRFAASGRELQFIWR